MSKIRSCFEAHGTQSMYMFDALDGAFDLVKLYPKGVTNVQSSTLYFVTTIDLSEWHHESVVWNCFQ